MQTVPKKIATRQITRMDAEPFFQSRSPLMKDIYQKVKKIADLDKHLILIGEIGVGKKSLAHAIHRRSSRAGGPFHSFYCMNTNENEFKEAFWEQVHVENEHLTLRFDVLEKASNGILYLNKFSELSTALKLNVIESYVHGCNQLFRYNFAVSPRLIISISQDSFQQFIQTEAWCRLLSLLNPVSIMLPPLRERREDIPAMIQTFIKETRNAEPSWHHLDITDDAIKECMAYKWPGNVRQLRNAISHGALLSQGKLIERHHLPYSMNWHFLYQTK